MTDGMFWFFVYISLNIKLKNSGWMISEKLRGKRPLSKSLVEKFDPSANILAILL